MIIGYSRVSTNEQNLDLQNDALKNFGCENIYQEKVSSFKSRPELQKALSFLRPDDTFVVWKLDRLARSLTELLNIINDLNARKIIFVAIQDKIDTNSAMGKFQIAVFGAIAEFERDIITERTVAGLEAARKRGRVGGRPRGSSDETIKKVQLVKKMREDKSLSVDDICKHINLSRSSFYRLLNFPDN
ncbi:MAG: recombinase family protein [Bacteroidia bacterium]|nr:recombinase family protein [Bacteroidia bacterium]